LVPASEFKQRLIVQTAGMKRDFQSPSALASAMGYGHGRLAKSPWRSTSFRRSSAAASSWRQSRAGQELGTAIPPEIEAQHSQFEEDESW